MGEWKRVKLSDLGRVVTGKTPSTKNEAFWNGSIPFVTPGDLQSTKHIFCTARYVTDDGANAVGSAVLPVGSICVSCIGVIGYVGITTTTSLSNQQINSIVVNQENDRDFVYYLLKGKWDEFKQMEGFSSVVSILNKSTFSDIGACVPDLPTQRRIAAVLGALDDKIEVNRKICENLEAQAQALFKAWFVDFEPFGGKRPEGWRDGAIGEYCKTVLGGTPSRDCPEYWGGNVAWINSGKVNEFRVISPSETITELGLKNSAAKLLPRKTTVLAITGATLGQVSLLEIDAAANQSVIGILESEKVPYTFIYPYVLSIIKELIEHQTGGAQQHINKDDVNSFRMSVPDAETMRKYDSTVRPMFEMIANKTFESRALAAMRDALLPKLMSGELDVEKVEVADACASHTGQGKGKR